MNNTNEKQNDNVISITELFCFNCFRKEHSMGDVILYLISLIFIGIMFFLSYRAITKAESLAEKITELIMAMVMFIVYVSSVISAIIGALVAFWTTIYQIKKNNEENNRRDKENLKIQNMPILKYDINTERKGTGDLSELIVTNKENELGNAYNLNIILKNIGMNSIKNILIDFQSSVINNSIYRLLGKNAVNPLEKGEVIELNKYFSLKPSDKYYEMIIVIYYQDVLSNWYKQKVEIHYNANNILSNANYSGTLTFKVQKEVEIVEDEIEKNVI